MTYAQGTKVWHPDFGYCKFERAFTSTPEYAYVDVKGWKGVLQKIKHADLRLEAPPKLTKEEKWQLRYQASLTKIRVSPAAYYTAGWITSHHSKFNLSHPPGQRDAVIDSTMKYGVDFTDKTMTESTVASSGWSCSVVTDTIERGVRDRLDYETNVKCTDYFSQTGRVSLQAREFVLGFLGGDLGIKLGEDQKTLVVRNKVPQEYLPYFDAGVIGAPLSV